MDFLREHLASIVFLVLTAAALLLLIRFGYVKKAKAILLCLVTEAEQKWGGGLGQVKFSAVAEMLYTKLPAAAKWLLSEKTIAALIERAVEMMKTCLAEEGEPADKED